MAPMASSGCLGWASYVPARCPDSPSNASAMILSSARRDAAPLTPKDFCSCKKFLTVERVLRGMSSAPASHGTPISHISSPLVSRIFPVERRHIPPAAIPLWASAGFPGGRVWWGFGMGWERGPGRAQIFRRGPERGREARQRASFGDSFGYAFHVRGGGRVVRETQKRNSPETMRGSETARGMRGRRAASRPRAVTMM